MPLEPMTQSIWNSPTPLSYALEHPDEPVQVWTPTRWQGMTQEDAGTWWTTVPVPLGLSLTSLEDYRARLLWMLEIKMSQYLLDREAEGMSLHLAINLANRQISSVLPDLQWISGVGSPLERLLNLDYSILRELMFPEGTDEFPILPEAMATSTLSMLTDSWNLIDWLNNLQYRLTEDSRW